MPTSITPQDLYAFLQTTKGNYTILDVREPKEYETMHISGSTLIPTGDIQKRLEEIKSFPQPLYVHCASGSRSALVSNFLKKNGVEAINVTGGILGWIGANLPIKVGAE